MRLIPGESHNAETYYVIKPQMVPRPTMHVRYALVLVYTRGWTAAR